jgi:hypothetical protein
MSVPQVTFEVTTTSEVIPNWQTPATPPTITINNNPIPAPSDRPFTPSGYQVVVINQATDMTQPSAITSNFYVQLEQMNGAWADLWQFTYARMVTQLLTSGDPQTQIVIVASYGWDGTLPPTNDALEQLLDYGAGSELQSWIANATDVGSEGGDWTAFPTNYILIGANSLPWGQGAEEVEFSNQGQPVKTSVSATYANPAAALAGLHTD